MINGSVKTHCKSALNASGCTSRISTGLSLFSGIPPKNMASNTGEDMARMRRWPWRVWNCVRCMKQIYSVFTLYTNTLILWQNPNHRIIYWWNNTPQNWLVTFWLFSVPTTKEQSDHCPDCKICPALWLRWRNPVCQSSVGRLLPSAILLSLHHLKHTHKMDSANYQLEVCVCSQSELLEGYIVIPHTILSTDFTPLNHLWKLCIVFCI